MTDDLFLRTAVLANGERVPLQSAAAYVGLLAAYLQGHDAEWDPVFLLRELSLGRSILPEQLRSLRSEKLVDSDGEVDPVLRSVVLSAVRGEGAVLRIDSPFTDEFDRVLAELINAREYLRSHLSSPEAEAALRSDPIGHALKLPPKPPSWGDRQRLPDDPSNLPPR